MINLEGNEINHDIRTPCRTSGDGTFRTPLNKHETSKEVVYRKVIFIFIILMISNMLNYIEELEIDGNTSGGCNISPRNFKSHCL